MHRWSSLLRCASLLLSWHEEAPPTASKIRNEIPEQSLQTGHKFLTSLLFMFMRCTSNSARIHLTFSNYFIAWQIKIFKCVFKWNHGMWFKIRLIKIILKYLRNVLNVFSNHNGTQLSEQQKWNVKNVRTPLFFQLLVFQGADFLQLLCKVGGVASLLRKSESFHFHIDFVIHIITFESFVFPSYLFF